MRYRLVLLILFPFICSAALADDSKKADPLGSMEAMAKKFESFFSSNPRLLFKHVGQYYSVTGASYQFIQYRANAISYDVVKTDSLVTPYSAYIIVEAMSPPAASPCSSQKIGNVLAGWPTSTDALRFKDKPECFQYSAAQLTPDPLRFNFAFQKNSWVLKSIVRMESGKPEQLLSAALLGTSIENSRPVDDEDGRQFNMPWNDLIR